MAISRTRLALLLLVLGLLIGTYGAWRLATPPAIAPSELGRSAEALLARSREVLARASPTYQEEVLAALAPNAVNGAYFRLDDMAGEASASIAAHRGGASSPPRVVLAYEFEDPSAATLSVAQSLSSTRIVDGLLTVDHRAPDYLTNTLPIAVPKDDVARILIRARAARGTHMLLGWHGKEPKTSPWRHSIRIDLVPGGGFRTYSVDARNALKRGLAPGAKIERLLLRPSNADRDLVEIDFIRLVSVMSRYGERPYGSTYETLENEMRAALYMSAPTTLRYSVEVPSTAPELSFGLGALGHGARPEFLVSVDSTEIFRQASTEAAGWQDVSLDLSRWAGKKADISLSVERNAPGVALWSSPVVRSAPQRRFNVIIILEDTLRADHLSCYGYGLATSPMRDELAASGVLFERAVSQATKTRPSVASFMTSLLPTATGVWGHSDYLHEHYLTLAEILRSQGFATASFIQNGNAGPYAGLHQGFDAIADQRLFGWTSEALVGEPLLDWLERHRATNFFLYIHLADPHGPYEPRTPFDDWYRGVRGQGESVERDRALDPDWVESPTDRGRRSRYDGEILSNDHVLRRFVDELRRLALWDETLLVLVSDHGEHLGEHGLWEHHPPGYSQVVHVPLILVHPSRLAPGRRVPETVQLIDLMPTILDLGGVDSSPLYSQGDSLVALIENRRQLYWKSRLSVSEEPTSMNRGSPCGCGSLYLGEWHLIDSRSFGRPPGLRIFQSSKDEQELDLLMPLLRGRLLQPRFDRVMMQLQTDGIEAWKQWTAGDSGFVPLDPEVQDQLKALGYIQ